MASLIFLIKKELKNKTNYGESRHAAKMQHAGKPPGIYAKNTYKTYLKHSCNGANWVREQYPAVKDLDDLRGHVGEYLQHCIDEGHSAHSIATYASAFGKLYGCRTMDFGVELPQKGDPTRGRIAGNSNEKRSTAIDKLAVEFNNLVGLRDKEIRQFNAHFHRDFLVGKTNKIELCKEKGSGTKGGRPRAFIPLDPDRVREVFRDAQELARAENKDVNCPFRTISDHANMQQCRRNVAQAVYWAKIEELGDSAYNDKYVCRDGTKRVFDRTALNSVSVYLGHGEKDRGRTVIKYYFQ